MTDILIRKDAKNIVKKIKDKDIIYEQSCDRGITTSTCIATLSEEQFPSGYAAEKNAILVEEAIKEGLFVSIKINDTWQAEQNEQKMHEKNIKHYNWNILLIVDVQKQFKDKNGMYKKCLSYIKDHKDEYYVIGTLFRNKPKSIYVNKLGYEECMESEDSDIEYPYDDLIIKSGYSANQDNKLTKSKWFSGVPDFKPHIDIIGCDADACVLATAFDLWDNGFDFSILSDYIYTTGEIPVNDTLKIMKRNFGECVK